MTVTATVCDDENVVGSWSDGHESGCGTLSVYRSGDVSVNVSEKRRVQ